MQYNKEIINYYYSIFNDIDNLLKYNINTLQTKLINNNINQDMINVIKKSILETLETPYYYKLFQIKNYNNLLEIINATYINNNDYKKYFNNNILFKYYIHNNNNNLYYILKILYEYKFYNLNIINISNSYDNLYNLISNTILSHVKILQKFDILPSYILEYINVIINLNNMNEYIYLHIVSSLYYAKDVINDDISILKTININNKYFNNLKPYEKNTIDNIIKEIIYYQYLPTKNLSINIPTKNYSINIPSKNGASINIPTKNGASINIPTKNGASINIPTKNPFINIPSRNSNSINIPPKNCSINIPTKNSNFINIPPKNSFINNPIINKSIKHNIYILNIPIPNELRPIVKLYDKYYYYIIINNKYYYSPVK